MPPARRTEGDTPARPRRQPDRRHDGRDPARGQQAA
jgi:hypothetical protein